MNDPAFMDPLKVNGVPLIVVDGAQALAASKAYVSMPDSLQQKLMQWWEEATK